MHKYLKISCILLIIGCLSIIYYSCKSSDNGKPVVTVSIQPQKYLLEKIVGDKFEVNCLLNQNSNPESFQPNMSHLMNLENSIAYFQIGNNLGFELAIGNKIKKTYPDLKIFNTSKGINPLIGTHETSYTPNSSKDVDPHIWSSVKNAKIMAKNMCDNMCEISPKNKKYFIKNLNKLIKELDTLDDNITGILAPVKGKAFLVIHPSLSYFARDYGLSQISLGTIGKESSLKDKKDRIDTSNDSNVLVFLYQPEFDSHKAESFINSSIPTAQINPMSYDWDKEMLRTAHAIAGK